MNSLERMIACVKGDPFDQYPFIELHPMWSLMPHFPQLVGLTHLHADYGSDEERIRCHAVPYDILGQDWITLPMGPAKEDRGRYQIEVDGDIPMLADTEAKTYKRFEKLPEEHQVDKPVITTASEAEKLPLPETADQLLESGYYDITRKFVKQYKDKTFLLLDYGAGPFAYCYYMLGFEMLMDVLHSDPRLLHILLERKTEEIINNVKAAAHVGAHAFRAWEMFCGADMISEKHFMEFVFPYNLKIMHSIRDKGLIAVFQMLGWIAPRLPQIAYLEMDCLQTDCTLKNHRNDVEKYRTILGEEVCISGNFSIDVIEKGDEIVWRQAVTEQARGVGEQRRYCICGGTPTTWATSPEKLMRFGNFARRTLAEIAPPLGHKYRLQDNKAG